MSLISVESISRVLNTSLLSEYDSQRVEDVSALFRYSDEWNSIHVISLFFRNEAVSRGRTLTLKNVLKSG